MVRGPDCLCTFWMFTSHSRWSLLICAASAVPMTLFTLSVGFTWAWYLALYHRCRTLYSPSRFLNSLEVNCDPLSHMIICGTPNNRNTWFSRNLTTLLAVAFASGCTSTNLVNQSHTTNNWVLPFRDRGSGPIRSSEMSWNGKLTFLAAPISPALAFWGTF